MSDAAIEHLILEYAGLNSELLGSGNIARAVADGMERTGLRDQGEYLQLLKSSAAEMETLINNLVVAETWFFRDHEPFVFLNSYIQSVWLPSHPKQQLRILSAPCSTGEEPYSIAIMLLEMGLMPEQFHIDAADISRHAVETARRAVYHDRAFRGHGADGRDRYFRRTAEGRVLEERVQRLIHFHVANLVQPAFLAGQAPYHVVFCRNMVIYLVEAARAHVLHNLNRLLVPRGILVVGHAELTYFQQAGYAPVAHARSFACIQGGQAACSKAPQQERMKTRHISARHSVAPPTSVLSRPVRSEAEADTPDEPDRERSRSDASERAENALIPIRRLADQGSLDQARLLCEQFLHEYPSSAEAYCLLGLIHQASDRLDAAETGYLKALYLNPRCVEALVHLGLCYARRGDAVKAMRFKERAQRMEITEKQPA